MTKIKICGIREPEHALIAAEEGADFIGVIFANMSSRVVTPEEACQISDALRQAYGPGNGPKLVGIFVNSPAFEINSWAEMCRLDMIQLSGDEPWSFVQAVERPVIKALRLPAGSDPSDVSAMLDEHLPALAARNGFYFLESHVTGRYGGTGQQLDWSMGAQVANRHSFLLSGGLSPDNVEAALRQVRPWGVDVSSGVESDGRKDESKIRAFIRAVRAFDEAQASLITTKDKG